MHRTEKKQKNTVFARLLVYKAVNVSIKTPDMWNTGRKRIKYNILWLQKEGKGSILSLLLRRITFAFSGSVDNSGRIAV